MSNLITIKNCKVTDNSKKIISDINWKMKEGEAWLVTGVNGSGKADFIKALSGSLNIEPNENSQEALYSNIFSNSTSLVSLEEAAHLIEEERKNDQSEILNKEDIGRTARVYLSEVTKINSLRLETLPEVKLCGIEKILDRGLKYLSTGEIRRTLLCRALLSNKSLIILSDPFAGLDASSRKILLEFFNTIANRQLNAKGTELSFPRIILSMERFFEIPEAINCVLEFNNKQISYCGSRLEYEQILLKRNEEKKQKLKEEKNAFLDSLKKIREETQVLTREDSSKPITTESLIRFEDVNVGWDEHKVLINLNWEVKKGEHWLLRGPNGSGKTTILELITGDNMQVFREKIFIFGKKRGTGETIWDIKKNLGIVSYRLHVEYRMVGGTSLCDTIISGFHDSIGLYEKATDFKKATAYQWLSLAGFKGRENEAFGSLSYGEQRAILILRAAVKSPLVLILDEPCHGLDENYRTKILDLLNLIAETETTTLLHVTHDPSEVLECEKHILELSPDKTPMYKIIESGKQ